jgi:hypothetical protein
MASGVLRSVPEQSDDPAGAGPLRFSRKNSPLVHMFNFHTDPCVRNVLPGVSANSHGVASKALPVVSCPDPMCVRRQRQYLLAAMSGAELCIASSPQCEPLAVRAGPHSPFWNGSLNPKL